MFFFNKLLFFFNMILLILLLEILFQLRFSHRNLLETILCYNLQILLWCRVVVVHFLFLHIHHSIYILGSGTGSLCFVFNFWTFWVSTSEFGGWCGLVNYVVGYSWWRIEGLMYLVRLALIKICLRFLEQVHSINSSHWLSCSITPLV